MLLRVKFISFILLLTCLSSLQAKNFSNQDIIKKNSKISYFNNFKFSDKNKHILKENTCLSLANYDIKTNDNFKQNNNNYNIFYDISIDEDNKIKIQLINPDEFEFSLKNCIWFKISYKIIKYNSACINCRKYIFISTFRL